jgi:CDP-glucose 4,6-dehydratase
MIDQEFWKDKRVFLTGHTGFKGSWLCLWLQQLGADVTGYSLAPPTNPSLFDVANVAQGMKTIIGDIRDGVMLSNAMSNAAPEIVIHMAAQPLVRQSYIDPVETYSTNVMGTVHLLEAVRGSPSVRAVVIVTTDKCYENKEWVWGYRESDPMGGYDPYSSSKGCAELVTSAFRASFFNPFDYSEHKVGLATARAGNVIGGGDWASDRLIPDMIAAFKKGENVHIRNPGSTRPWQHVLEPLRGYLVLAENLVRAGAEFSEGWNFGPNSSDAKPVKSIVKKMIQYWGDGAAWDLDNSENSHEAGYLKLDISKADCRLNWRPLLNLDQALKLTVDWSKNCKNGVDPREETLKQISDYQKKF